MKVKIIAVLILVLGAVITAPCYCDYQDSDSELRVFDGKVVDVNIGESLLTVKGITEIVFPISNDTKMIRDIYDIKLSDIDKGDYVTVEYYRRGDTSRVPLDVIKVTVGYKKE